MQPVVAEREKRRCLETQHTPHVTVTPNLGYVVKGAPPARSLSCFAALVFSVKTAPGVLSNQILHFVFSNGNNWKMTSGLQSKDAEQMFQTLRTVKHMRPVIFIFENSTKAQKGLDVVKEMVDDHTEGYNMVCLSDMDPTVLGFPTAKPRYIMVGVRDDQAVRASVTKAFSTFLEQPMPCKMDFEGLLGLVRPVPVVFSIGGQSAPE